MGKERIQLEPKGLVPGQPISKESLEKSHTEYRRYYQPIIDYMDNLRAESAYSKTPICSSI